LIAINVMRNLGFLGTVGLISHTFDELEIN
jgi:hypothetical protein